MHIDLTPLDVIRARSFGVKLEAQAFANAYMAHGWQVGGLGAGRAEKEASE